MSTIAEQRHQRAIVEIDKGVEDLREKLKAEFSKNPNFFGGGSLDIRIQDGSVVGTKISLDVSRKP